ncbi:hypothetical protein GCM10022233_57040 [Streptomyces shaanxiensis]|uniref:Uncharacterized protein n=1 Tax=Streptomyces shaanxiensis TaxID=653357 RepID=A0ABP7VS39_9ACTN
MGQDHLTSNDPSPVRRFAVNAASAFISQDSTAGAPPTLYAATQDLPRASYVGPDGNGERTGAPTPIVLDRTASDPESARRLWTLSEELTGVTFPDRLEHSQQSAPAASQPGSQHVDLTTRRERVEAVLAQPANHQQASQ